MWTRFLLIALAVVVLAAVGFLAFAWEPAITLVGRPDKAAFGREQVERGAELAAIGNCITCHTSAGGKPYAGGRAMATPFGTIYATNITPDPNTGIGRWSEQAFTRALREGVNQQGQHLYPAFPYDHFTRLTDDDVKALYAFMMTREPASATAPANDLPFPLNIRLTLAAWKLLFFDKGRFAADPARDQAWNRGAYLTEALAHCGACHTPRNGLGAEERQRHFAGGSAEGWHAPALNADNPAPVPWNAETIATYLRSGFEALHGAAAGPMADVARNLADVTGDDVRAIALYVDQIAGPPSAARQEKADALLARLDRAERETVGHAAAGEQAEHPIFAGACATCHTDARSQGPAQAVSLALSSELNAPDPRNAIRIVLYGIHPAEGERKPLMPGFAEALNDRQVAELLADARSRYSSAPAWSYLEDRVRRIRGGDDR
jgi:mono/diheme cytochrome c family protein